MASVQSTPIASELLDFETRLVSPGQVYAGVDEAGRGALAGPVVAAAVILGGQANDFEGVADSKKLSKKQRERLALHIRNHAVAVSVALADPSEIDELNILHASRLAMARALYGLPRIPEVALIDGPYPPLYQDYEIYSIPVIEGDAKCLSVAAASIIAKVERDRMMADLHKDFPDYGFDRHAGYPTSQHLAALDAVGPSRVHRYSYRPVILASQSRLDL